MRSSIFTAPEPPDLPGYVVVGHLPAGYPQTEDPDRVVLHAERGKGPPPDCIEVIVDGAEFDWNPAAIEAMYPLEAPYVLDAEWWDNGEIVRGKVVDVPPEADVHRTGLLPHLFCGEDP